MSESEVMPVAAATTIFVRARGTQPEVLLLKRGEHAKFMPNAYVFAGGVLDPGDAAAASYAVCGQFDDQRASERLSVAANGLSHHVAAIREAFEECGLLLATDANRAWVDLSSWEPARLHELRLAVSTGKLSLAELCSAHGWWLAVDRIEFFSHWITPRGMQRRYDTRFFLCPVPANQPVSLASAEMSEIAWRTPGEALAEHARRRILLMYPTRTILKQLAQFPSIDALFEFARQPRAIQPFTPLLPASLERDGPPAMP